MALNLDRMANLLIELGEKPDLRQQFKQDPVTVSTAFGLTKEEMCVLDLEDPEGLAALFKSATAQNRDLTFVVADWEVACKEEPDPEDPE